jgi:Fic family protein
MGYYQEAFWLNEGQGASRAERRSGAFHYYVPTRLSLLHLRLETDVVSDIVRAEKALSEMNAFRGQLHDVDSLSRFLLRVEAVSSSYIEGLQMDSKRLMQAELNNSEPHTFKADPAAAEIIGNIQALRKVVDESLQAPSVTQDSIIAIHEALLANTPYRKYAGKVRGVQNWIGGNAYNPLNAAHVPPAPELLPELLTDLVDFCNRTDVSPVQQAAIAHAQFELIHPFVDGNGRAGRALIHLILRRRGLLETYVPPISLILATYGKNYIAGLKSLCFKGEQPDETGMDAINEWLSFFSGSCVRACDEIVGFAGKASELEARWRSQLSQVRRGSSLDLFLGKLVGMPVFTVNTASCALDRSFQSVNPAIERLVAAGIAKPLRSGKRFRAFEVPEALDAFRAFERKLASPAGDTRTAEPARPVPYRG